MKIISLPLSMAERRCFLDSFEKQDVNRAKYSGLCLSFRNSRKKKIWERGKLRQTGLCRRGQERRKILLGIATRLRRKRVFCIIPGNQTLSPLSEIPSMSLFLHISHTMVSLFLTGGGRGKEKEIEKKRRLAATLLLLSFPI